MTASHEPQAGERLTGQALHRARAAALQMLYQSDVGRVPINEVTRTFWTQAGGDVERLDDTLRGVAERFAAGAAAAAGEADPLIAEAAEHWRLERLQVMDRLILRLGVYEMIHHPETPPAVVIDEAIELARTFSGEASAAFVNGVLDAIRRRLDRA